MLAMIRICHGNKNYWILVSSFILNHFFFCGNSMGIILEFVWFCVRNDIWFVGISYLKSGNSPNTDTECAPAQLPIIKDCGVSD